jgi:hypothetical protein
MRRRLELALAVLVAIAVSMIAYHIVNAWPRTRTVTATATAAMPPNPALVQILADLDKPLPLTFEVTGGEEVDVTYFPGPGGTKVRARVRTPWTVTVQASGHIAANVIALTATATTDRTDAAVACRIFSSEFGHTVPLFEDEAYGPHAIARCSAT